VRKCRAYSGSSGDRSVMDDECVQVSCRFGLFSRYTVSGVVDARDGGGREV
jgi:hypothetical protein